MACLCAWRHTSNRDVHKHPSHKSHGGNPEELLHYSFVSELSVRKPWNTPTSLIVDPVAISTSGHTLLPSDAIEALVKDPIPITTVITPNIQEARLLLSHLRRTGPEEQEIKSLADMIAAARNLTQESGASTWPVQWDTVRLASTKMR